MFLVLALVLAVIYVVALLAVHTIPIFFHLLIVFAVISLVLHLVRGNKS